MSMFTIFDPQVINELTSQRLEKLYVSPVTAGGLVRFLGCFFCSQALYFKPP